MLKKFVPDLLLTKDGTIEKTKVFEAPLIGLYFSALWCPPCVGFNPLMLDFYKKANSDKLNIEIIFCSLDEDEEDFKQYLKKLPFPAIDYSDTKLEDLTTAFEIETIPVLIVFDKYGNLIEVNGRSAIQGKNKLSPEKAIKAWLEKSKQKNNNE